MASKLEDSGNEAVHRDHSQSLPRALKCSRGPLHELGGAPASFTCLLRAQSKDYNWQIGEEKELMSFHCGGMFSFLSSFLVADYLSV